MARRQRGTWLVAVGPLVCPECGADSVESRRPGWWERLRYWLRNGGAAPTAMTCALGHEWSSGGGRTLTYGGRGGRWRWLRLPIELARVVYRERSMVPVPLTYLVAALVGLGLGVIADAVAGWPWWLVAAAFVVAVWLLFLASALWGPGRSLGDDLWMVIDPVRAEEREFSRLEGAVASGRIVCFEVAGWEGSRSLGGWGGSTQPDRITLRHGDPERDARWVSVTSRIGRRADVAVSRDRLGRELLRAEQSEPPDGLDAHQMHRRQIEQRRHLEQLPPPAWSPDALSVDGQSEPCDIARVADRWAAVTKYGESIIEVMAKGVDIASTGLQHLETLEVYIRGLRQDRTKRRREHGH